MRRSIVLRVLLSAALLVAASCSSGDDDTASSAGEARDSVNSSEAVEEEDAGEAVPVTMALDDTAASVTAVGPEGATIGATAADGTEYALQILPGSLAETTDIVMTPLLGLTGLPDGAELAFGVSLEPSGLVFARPSWLYVTADVESDDVTGLAIHDGEATLRGIGFDGARFVLPVGHFSGAGACFPRCGGGGGWPGFPDSPGGRGAPGGPGGSPTTPGPGVPPYQPPGTPPGAFPGGDGTTGGGGASGHGSLTGDAGGGRSTGDASGGTDAAVADAVQDLADAQLNGDEDAERRANEKLDKVKERVKGEAWKSAEECVNEKDVTKLKGLLHWLVLGQLLGAAKEDAEEQTLTSLIDVCFRFELDVMADLTAKFGGNTFVIGDSIELTVPLLFNGLALEGTVTGTVDPTGYDRGAEVLEVLGVGMAAVIGTDIPNDLGSNDFFQCTTQPGTGTIDAIAEGIFADTGPTVNVVPSVASTAVVNCQAPFTNMPMSPFVVDLTYYPEADFPGASETGILFETWTVTGDGASHATKSVHHSISEEGAELLFAWDLVLRHAPGPLPPRPR